MSETCYAAEQLYLQEQVVVGSLPEGRVGPLGQAPLGGGVGVHLLHHLLHTRSPGYPITDILYLNTNFQCRNSNFL